MKYLLTAIAFVIIFTGAAPAREQLHSIYLGQWCSHDSEHYLSTESPCSSDEVQLTMQRDGLKDATRSCHFISITKTGTKLPAVTKPDKEDWIPVVNIVARCRDDVGIVWRQKMQLSYMKGSLTIKDIY